MSNLVGETIDGRYTVARALGQGAMGSVFVATSPDYRGEVALKVVWDGAADELRAPQRFLREVKSLNKSNHPNIVALLDFGRDEERHLSYMVLELARGDDVSCLTAMGRTPPPLALLVAEQVAQGLCAAHDVGIIHRDLKPANLMLCPQKDGTVTVKILDFGLAMLLDADTRLTKTGTAPGTVTYMSPEQLLGDPVDHRADIYSTGVILYEMLAGRSPFVGENQTEIAMAVLSSVPRPLQQRSADIPPPLSELVSSMMSRRPEDRPADARELAELAASVSRQLSLPPVRATHLGPSENPRAAWRLRPPV